MMIRTGIEPRLSPQIKNPASNPLRVIVSQASKGKQRKPDTPPILEDVSTSTSSIQSSPPDTSFSSSTPQARMVQVKIRTFYGLRDGREDPVELLEDIDYAYERDNRDADKEGTNHDKEHRLIFRQHLDCDAYTWYRDLSKEVKLDWAKLEKAFLTEFEITEKDAQAK